jgi:integrase
MAIRTGVNLTKAEILKIKPGASIIRVWDLATRGLGIQVTPSGVYSWILSYRIRGKKDMTTLGRWPEMTVEQARKAAISGWERINAGENLNEAKVAARKASEVARRAAVDVAHLVERYLEEHTPGNSEGWQAESKRLMNKHILPALGKMPVQEVGPAEVSAFLYKMSKATPVQANRTRAVLRTMFSRAEEWGLRPLGSNPVAVVKQRTPEVKRERRLSDLELKALGKAMQDSKEAPELILAIRLALLAGMRKGEIQAARWEWCDLEAGEIRIPPEFHKTGKKTGKTRVVHLCSALVAELKAMPATLGCPYLIPGRPKKKDDGSLVWEPFTALQNPWERIRVLASLAVDGKPKDDDPGLHDLRRTFGSVAADLGLRGFVGELLGHAEQSVTDIYTRTAAEPLLQAAESIGSRIDGILSGRIDPEKETEERREAKEAKAKEASGCA